MSTNPLANPIFRRLFAAQVTALVGTGLSTVALALLAFDLAGERAGAVLGTALALKMVAYVGVAPLFGVLAQRVDRRRLLVSLDVARAALIACMPFVSAVWEIYALIFLLNSCSAGFTPTFQATVPDVLPDEAVYTRALSLSRIAYDLENVLSPALAALALVVVSYDALFAANALTFLVSAALVTSVALPSAGRSGRGERFWRNATTGIRYYLATPRLRGLLALSLAVSAAGAMVIVNTVVYVRHELGGSDVDTAIVLAANGAGSLLVAVLLPALLGWRGERALMLAGGVFLGAALLLGLYRPGLLGLLPIWLMIGAGSALVQTPAGRLLTRSTAEADRPSVFAAQFALSHACWLISYPLAGWLGLNAGLGFTFAALAAIALAATLAAARLWPSMDPVELMHRHEPIRHEHEHVHDEHHGHAHAGWEGPEPHSHPHEHGETAHSHRFVIDHHHPHWPR